MTQATPIVKWAGGKGALVDELLSRAPVRFDRYVEPFCGGAALFFALTIDGEAVLGDANADLIATYEAVATMPENVAQAVAELARERNAAADSTAHYYEQRRLWNALAPAIDEVDQVERAARFLYLNRCGYNGLWRVNNRGKHNVPAGRHEADPLACVPNLVRAAAPKLARAALRCSGYGATLNAIRSVVQQGDFIYLDPPYVPLNPTSSFTAYTAGGFGEQQQRELATIAFEYARRGAHVLASNSDTPLVRELYAEAQRIDVVRVRRSINSRAGGRGAVGEVIIHV